MIVRAPLTHDRLTAPFLKAVADVARGVFATDCDLHVDCAEELLKDGSLAADLWGFNIYPDGHLDYVSLINIRPANGNRTMNIQSDAIRAQLTAIVSPFLP